MKYVFPVLLIACILSISCITQSFATKDEDIVKEDPCSVYLQYPSHYRKCLTRQKQLKRMKTAKERRTKSKERRKERFEKNISKNEQIKLEQEAEAKKAIEEAEKIKLEKEEKLLESNDEETPEADNTENTDKESSIKKKTSGKIIIDPKKLNKSQIIRITQILAENQTSKSSASYKPPETSRKPKMKTIKPPSVPVDPSKPIKVKLPRIGIQDPQYIELDPLATSDLYKAPK